MSQMAGLQLRFPYSHLEKCKRKLKSKYRYSAAGDGGSYNSTAICVSRRSPTRLSLQL